MRGQTTDPVACARTFIDAILWGAHAEVWELLSDRGRETVLAVAVARGLDRVTARRIREGQSDPVDREAFLRELVVGLRRDLRSVDPAKVTPSGETRTLPDGDIIVYLVTPSEIPGTADWPAGEVVVGRSPDGDWRVHRLEPRVVP